MKRNHGMVNHLAAIMLTGLKGRSKLKREIWGKAGHPSFAMIQGNCKQADWDSSWGTTTCAAAAVPSTSATATGLPRTTVGTDFLQYSKEFLGFRGNWNS
jgi:hypothetical protein